MKKLIFLVAGFVTVCSVSCTDETLLRTEGDKNPIVVPPPPPTPPNSAPVPLDSLNGK